MKAHTHSAKAQTTHKPRWQLRQARQFTYNDKEQNYGKTKITITASTNPLLCFLPSGFFFFFSLSFFFSKKGERHKSRERSERSQTKPPFTLMAGLLNACVHSGLFLVVSGRLRVLQLTVSSRFWDQFFRSKGTDVVQRRMWIPMMDHCLGLGSGCVCVSFCVSACVYLCERFRATPCRRSRTCSSCMHVH